MVAFQDIVITMLVIVIGGVWIGSLLTDAQKMYSITIDSQFQDNINKVNKISGENENVFNLTSNLEKSVDVNQSSASSQGTINSLIQSTLGGLIQVKDSMSIYKDLINNAGNYLKIPPVITRMLAASVTVVIVFLLVQLFWFSVRRV